MPRWGTLLKRSLLCPLMRCGRGSQVPDNPRIGETGLLEEEGLLNTPGNSNLVTTTRPPSVTPAAASATGQGLKRENPKSYNGGKEESGRGKYIPPHSLSLFGRYHAQFGRLGSGYDSAALLAIRQF